MWATLWLWWFAFRTLSFLWIPCFAYCSMWLSRETQPASVFKIWWIWSRYNLDSCLGCHRFGVDIWWHWITILAAVFGVVNFRFLVLVSYFGFWFFYPLCSISSQAFLAPRILFTNLSCYCWIATVCPVPNAGHLVSQHICTDLLSERVWLASPSPFRGHSCITFSGFLSR